MMDKHPFFILIWRINGIALLVVSILSIVLMSIVGYHVVDDVFGTRNVSGVVNIDEQQADIKQNLALAYASQARGSDYLMLSLTLEQYYAQSYYEKDSTSVRNYLFMNAKNNNEQHWLLDTHQYLITDYHLLSESDQQNTNPTLAILYHMIKNDSNHDKRLTTTDLLTIGLSHPDGTAYQDVLKDVDELILYKLLDHKTLLVLYQKAEQTFSAHISLINFTIHNTAPISMQMP